MTSHEDLVYLFQGYSINPSADVLEKCVSLCLTYNIDAEELVDQWVAYTQSNLKSAAPTVELLERMERKEYQKGKDQTKIVREQSQYVASPDQSTNVSDFPATPKANRVPTSRIQTPIQSRRLVDDPEAVTSPGAPIGSYSKRTNARSVQCSYGRKDASYKGSEVPVDVKPYSENCLKADQRFMYEIIGKRGKSLSNMAQALFPSIRNRYQLHALDENKKNEDEQQNLYEGRIISDYDTKINVQSVQLEQTHTHQGRTFQLNLSKVKKMSLFPGQVVIVKGKPFRQYSDSKTEIVVEEIYAGTVFKFSDEFPVTKDPLQIVVACGPFTIQDTLLFEPLSDLLIYVKEYKPHVLILTGPFYERNNQGIHNGDLRQQFDAFFMDLVDTVMTALAETGVKVVIASSQREPHHFPVYPTPPYEIRGKYENLLLVPDPCLVEINGLVVGVNTPDVLFHLSSFEIYLDNKPNAPISDRMGRLASHLLEQRSFYPLDPPNPEVCIDMPLMEKHGIMDVKPHILILPSNLKHFIKEIQGCLVVNPERLTKGYGGGTFARIEVAPGGTMTVCGRTSCQILRI
ncbi:DNA polymerase alpha subunit B [Sitophilus oryzae]|uniref:DNA polymerase alpha subunit B n=1 Tax=Sitophilus oryzae TaxID=7048 RepID=A0A6J2XPM9_SITOR|nr:DNA polymerase alpha subunit B [Sitophilus oryzae]